MSILQDEIKNDPLGIKYSSLKAVEVENEMNTAKYPVAGLVSIGSVVSTLYNSGTFDAIFGAAMAGNDQAKAALEKLKTLVALGIQSIDCGHPKALSDMAAAGVPQEDIDTITKLATTMKTRAEVLGLPYVTASMVEEALG